MCKFGWPCDLAIYENCDQNLSSYSGYGASSSSFEIINVSNPNNYLAGAKNFKVKEFEVFKLTWEENMNKILLIYS